MLKTLNRAGELDDLGSHQSMVAIGHVELGEKRVCGPLSEAVGNVLAVTGVVWKGAVEVADDVGEVKGVRLGRWKALVEEYDSCNMGGFFDDGRESSSKRGRGMFSLFESVSEAMMHFVGFEKTLGILKVLFGFPGVF